MAKKRGWDGPKKLKCFLDGNALCIIRDDFINLQESECLFITLTEKQIGEIRGLSI